MRLLFSSGIPKALLLKLLYSNSFVDKNVKANVGLSSIDTILLLWYSMQYSIRKGLQGRKKHFKLEEGHNALEKFLIHTVTVYSRIPMTRTSKGRSK